MVVHVGVQIWTADLAAELTAAVEQKDTTIQADL